MIVPHEQLLTILWQPAHWADSSRFPAGWHRQESACHSLLNFWMIRHYQLSPLEDIHGKFSHTEALLLNYWQRLPQIAQLTGLALLKETLCSRDKLRQLTRPQLNFLALPLGQKKVAGDWLPEEAGAAFLLARLRNLPDALCQRFSLLFPAENRLHQVPVDASAGGKNLIRMAINHANTFSGRN